MVFNLVAYTKLIRGCPNGSRAAGADVECRAAATKAEEYLTRATTIDKDYGRAWVNLARAFNELSRYADASEAATKGISRLELDPYQYTAYQERQRALTGLGRPEDAERDHQKTQEIYQRNHK